MTKPRLVRTFEAHDAHGQAYTLHEYVEVHSIEAMGQPRSEKEGLREFRTVDGRHVNVLGEKRYQIVTSGTILTEP